MSAREFGAQLGSSPSVITIAGPPCERTTQMSNPPARCEVNAIHFPSGDQEGSVVFPAPGVSKCRRVPPLAETVNRLAGPRSRETKQIKIGRASCRESEEHE